MLELCHVLFLQVIPGGIAWDLTPESFSQPLETASAWGKHIYMPQNPQEMRLLSIETKS